MKLQKTFSRIIVASTGAAVVLAGALLAQITDQDAARILGESAFTQKAKTTISVPQQMNNTGMGGAAESGSMGNGGMGGGGGMGSGGGMNTGGGMANGGGMGNSGMGGGSMGGGGRRNGGGSNSSAARPAPKAPEVTLRWESSATVKEALVKTYGPESVDASHDDYYVITAMGLPMRAARRPGAESGVQGNDVQSLQQRAQQTLDAFKAGTTLNIKGKEKLQPAKVELGQRSGQTVVFFLFPRSVKVSAEDKEMDFECKAGMIDIKGKFKPKDMAAAGKLEM